MVRSRVVNKPKQTKKEHRTKKGKKQKSKRRNKQIVNKNNIKKKQNTAPHTKSLKELQKKTTKGGR